jgi:hypothetical protein
MKRLRNGAAAAMLLAGSASAASEEVYSYNSSGGWQVTHYVHFQTTSPDPTDSWTYGVLPSPQFSLSAPYSLTIPSGTACFEVETQPFNYSTQANDTRIWVYDLTTQKYRALDDDNGQGAYSKARVFLSGYSSIQLQFASKTAAYFGVKFEYKIKRLIVSEASCTTGQALPWVKRVGFDSYYSANVN